MSKSPDAFRTISEVAEWLGIQAHVLRFWESKFRQIKPIKRAGGRRYYRPADMQLIGGIKKLLHDDGMTIKGVQKLLKEQGIDHVSALSKALDDIAGEPAASDDRGTGATVVSFRGRPEPEDEVAEPEDTVPPEALSATEMLEPELDLDFDPVDEDDPETDAFEPEPEEDARPSVPPESAPKEPVAAPMSGAAVEAPEVDAEADRVVAAPGVLTHIAHSRHLSPEQARLIAPLAEELRGWLARHQSAGAA